MLTTPGDTMHDKETFREYLQFIGYSSRQVEEIAGRLIQQEPHQEDYLLFQQYIAGKEFKHLYDE